MPQTTTLQPPSLHIGSIRKCTPRAQQSTFAWNVDPYYHELSKWYVRPPDTTLIPPVGHHNGMSACHQQLPSFSEYLDVTAMSSRADSRKTNPYDSLTLTSMNKIAYMVTPLEDSEPPCEQKALVWNTSLKEVPEFNHSRWHLHPKSLTTFGHSSIT